MTAALQWKDNKDACPHRHTGAGTLPHAATRCGFSRQAAEQHPAVRSLRPCPQCAMGERAVNSLEGRYKQKRAESSYRNSDDNCSVCISTHIHSLFAHVLISKPESAGSHPALAGRICTSGDTSVGSGKSTP